MHTVTRPAAALAAVVVCAALCASPALAELVITGQSGSLTGSIDNGVGGIAASDAFATPATGGFDGRVSGSAVNDNGSTVLPMTSFTGRQAAAYSPGRIDLRIEGRVDSFQGQPNPGPGDAELAGRVNQTLRIDFTLTEASPFVLDINGPTNPLGSGTFTERPQFGGGTGGVIRLLGPAYTLDTNQPGSGPPVLLNGGVDLFSYNGNTPGSLANVRLSAGTLQAGDYTLEFVADLDVTESSGSYLFSPTLTVPEPATAGLLLLGGGLLTLRRRR